LVSAIANAGVVGDIVFVTHTARALAIQLLAFEAQLPHAVLASTQIDPATVIAIGVDGVGGYDGLPTIEASPRPKFISLTRRWTSTLEASQPRRGCRRFNRIWFC
jgi:hypothetical protein